MTIKKGSRVRVIGPVPVPPKRVRGQRSKKIASTTFGQAGEVVSVRKVEDVYPESTLGEDLTNEKEAKYKPGDKIAEVRLDSDDPAAEANLVNGKPRTKAWKTRNIDVKHLELE